MATKLATDILKTAYKLKQHQIDTDWFIQTSFSHEDKYDLELAFDELRNTGYINAVKIMGRRLPACFWLESAGKAYLERIENQTVPPTPSLHFSVENNYGAVGTNTNITINNSFDFDLLDKLITKNSSAGSTDRLELEELKALLQSIQNQQSPVEKGALAKFSDLMEKHSWLSSPIASFLISQFFSK